MDLFGMFSFPTWIALILMAFVLLYFWLTRTFNTIKKMGLTGPTPWPIFGTFYQFVMQSVPDITVNNHKRYGRVHGLYFGSRPVLSVSDVELVKEVAIKQFSNFPDRRSSGSFMPKELNTHLLSMVGDHWKHVRAILSPVFSTGKLKQMQPLIDQCVDGLITELEATESEDVMMKERMGAYTLAAIASTGFGLQIDCQKDPENEPFMKHASSLVNFASGWKGILLILIVMIPPMAKVLSFLGVSLVRKDSLDFFTDVLRQKIDSISENEVRRDFIQQVIVKRVDLATEPEADIRTNEPFKWSVNGLTDDEIISNAFVFFLAGYNTTSDLLQFVMYSLAVEPGVQEKLREEVTSVCGDGMATYEQLMKMDYLEWVINESLRMYPAAILLERVCVNDTTVGGYPIKKGMSIMFSVLSIHMDPEYWSDPTEFKPERFSPENRPDNLQNIWLPFGIGPRNCIGMRLALLKAKAAIARVVQIFDVQTTSKTPKKPLIWKKGKGNVDPVEPIVLRFEKRQ